MQLSNYRVSRTECKIITHIIRSIDIYIYISYLSSRNKSPYANRCFISRTVFFIFVLKRVRVTPGYPGVSVTAPAHEARKRRVFTKVIFKSPVRDYARGLGHDTVTPYVTRVTIRALMAHLPLNAAA